MKSKCLNSPKRWIPSAILFLLLVLNPLGLVAADAPTNAPPSTATATNAATSTNTWLTFGLDRVEWLQVSVMGNPLWQYLAALVYVVLAFYASKLLDYLIQVQLRKLTAKTKTQLDDLLLELIRGPVKIVAFVILLHVGLQVFTWPGWAETFISNALKIIVAASLTYVALKFVDLVMGLWQKRVEAAGEAVLDMQLFPVIRKSLKVFVIVVAFLVTSQNLGMNVTGLLASLSIGGLAVGLAAQDTLSNLFGAVALFADKPFRVGDRIQLDSIDGSVEAIGLRSTRIRNLDGHLVTVPNRTMANASLTNVSKRPNIKTVMNIGVTYDTPAEKVERAMKIIEDIYRPHPKTADLIISFNKFESSSLNILVVHWWDSTDFKEYLLQFQKLNLELKRRFDAEAISFAFPTQTLYLKQDSEWRVTSPESQATRN
ncbi:MAG TPA: mechanosensitive ion channel family protein [Candidatus Angelobacter sp.]|nr:mechanosensitive ion channel family protein [Candidatus Angelobacter sp.]